MGSFKDEVYEKLDYLSQLTEVVISPHNEVLARIPDRIEMTFEQLNLTKNYVWGRNPTYEINAYSLLTSFLPRCDFHIVNDIQRYFQFEVSSDFQIDFANQTMTGTACLVKTAHQVDEKKLLEMAIEKAGLQLSSYDWPSKRLREKTMTVLNTLDAGTGTEWAQKNTGSSRWAAVSTIKETMSRVILENKWRVRDATIILKMGTWINAYLSDNGDASTGLVNLLKLKMMLDKDLPVYSIDEVPHGVNL